ncbi:MAG TPA: homoserine dehydrogenase, partial [Pyrinomonadaceae bacterium]|nr:homoserine dehydrogenase [Pyrinomonadaceae bacterium]
PAHGLISRALRIGRHVVTANKSLLAKNVASLERLASSSGVTLKYNAAVGGVLPALETVSRARRFGPLHSITGVLNGTTNYILDQLANGSDLASAISAAQENGFAERDPQLDLDGTDAAQKLILLARAAFDVDLPLNSIRKQGIQNLNSVKNNGHVTRLVAECRRESNGFAATVSPVELPFDHPLAGVRGVENRLLIQSQTGRFWEVSGSGAGRWPTTEAVLADLFEVWRETNAAEEEQECVA